ncbi:MULTISPECIES: hypothetical protein [unclassified Streptomyces]|uniref:hypothetical protein n=1 Tax=unclassified Streptomyces TaxID=2593676 RepID=UPI0038037D3E
MLIISLVVMQLRQYRYCWSKIWWVWFPQESVACGAESVGTAPAGEFILLSLRFVWGGPGRGVYASAA